MSVSTVRTRFAPSPTGMLHIGGARTALFNWLFARHHRGKFILRIEDTDAARNTQEATDIITRGLSWLGLHWDEGPEVGGSYGPYYQSQRSGIYEAYLTKLLQNGSAYHDQDGTVRFRIPRESITVYDIICGHPTFDLKEEPDITLRRKDGSFIFHFVNVVDDIEMKITHVIRGEDHLSNTPKHIALYRALGATPPAYAHIPLILNPTGSKMSKRDQGASLADYMAQGYLPEAITNYLCLLGWSPGENREIFDLDLAVERFDLQHVNHSNARFDIDKLYWINGEKMRALTPERLLRFALPILQDAGLVSENTPRERVLGALQLVREKIKLGRDLPSWCSYLLKDDFAFDPEARAKHLDNPESRKLLASLHESYSKLDDWNASALEQTLKTLAEQLGVKVGALVHPCRVALTGRTIGPSLYHLLEYLGKEESLRRFKRVLDD